MAYSSIKSPDMADSTRLILGLPPRHSAWAKRPGDEFGLTSFPGTSAGLDPTNRSGTGWTVARYSWYDLFNKILVVIGVWCFVVAVWFQGIQPANERNVRQHLSASTYCCSFHCSFLRTSREDKIARKMPSGERTAEIISRLCGQTEKWDRKNVRISCWNGHRNLWV